MLSLQICQRETIYQGKRKCSIHAHGSRKSWMAFTRKTQVSEAPSKEYKNYYDLAALKSWRQESLEGPELFCDREINMSETRSTTLSDFNRQVSVMYKMADSFTRQASNCAASGLGLGGKDQKSWKNRVRIHIAVMHAGCRRPTLGLL